MGIESLRRVRRDGNGWIVSRQHIAIGILSATLAINGSSSARAENGGPKDGIPDASIASSLPANGDPGGHRKALSERGINYGFNYVGDLFGNATGGERRGTTYMGRLETFIDADLEKLAGLKGLYFHTHSYQVHGQRLSGEYIGNLFPVVADEALATTRLFELWLEQKLLNDTVSVKFGQIASDTDFITSIWAGQFVNNTFGWPTFAATNLPSGGPAYPMSTPGIREGAVCIGY